MPLWQYLGLPRWQSGKESTCQCRRHKRCGFDSSVGKIPWSRNWWPTPVILPGKFHGQRRLVGYSPWGHKRWTQLSTWQYFNYYKTKGKFYSSLFLIVFFFCYCHTTSNLSPPLYFSLFLRFPDYLPILG